MFKFPPHFLWGASISSYQTEGDNLYSDWWEWEKKKDLISSGRATEHYRLYKKDFYLAKELNLSALRLSIEWSRIQPKKNFFSKEEIKHYLEVIKTLRSLGIIPVVTLHHFTNPIWFAKEGGWLNPKTADYFLLYAQKIVEEFSRFIEYWITINEPLVYLTYGYLLGVWPPGEKSFFKAKKVLNNLIKAHLKIYDFVHRFYKKNHLPEPKISIAQNMLKFFICKDNFKNRLAYYLRDKFFNFYLLDKLTSLGVLDFIGINYYTRQLIDIEGFSLKDLFFSTCNKGHDSLIKSSLGWEIYPEGLYDLLLKLKRYNLSIIILENGIATSNDNLRWEYIKEHLKSIYLAMEKGAKVEGYFYWSLIDNFEWDKGFEPRFGLIEVNYSDFSRKIRDSALNFSQICKTGVLNEEQ
ncbi:MAG: glycoside hydrolase family 1 protein [Candidatus Omnitrophica bacterium]|nr:glycoside hydrolase family 1 protein [Candidatus Omnitrophota bacterium]